MPWKKKSARAVSRPDLNGEVPVEILRSVSDLRKILNPTLRSQMNLGLVPTMGFLHEGHLSLVRLAKSQNDRVVVSIYVNPTQFGPQEDFQQYPRDEARDLELLKTTGVEYVFIPSQEEMYLPGFSTFVEPPAAAQGWEGEIRPIHFRGVCTVVSLLFNQIQPHRAYFGRKDAQQAAVIRSMTRDLQFPIEIIVGPTVRDTDGLALSSRNIYLSSADRERALILYRTLREGIQQFQKQEQQAEKILSQGTERIAAAGVKLDYLGIVDPYTFQSQSVIRKGDLYIGAIRLGKTRLIDNLIFAAEG